MQKFMTLAVILLAVTYVTATMSLSELKRHNELETKEEKLNEIMSKIDQHCEAVALNKTVAGRRLRRSAVDAGEEVLRELLDSEIGCSDDSQDPNPTQPPTSLPIDGPCTSSLTVNLTGSWRKDAEGSRLQPANGFFACDRELQYARHWFRFTGDGGSQLADTCRPDYSCGGHGSFWSNADMPTKVGEIWQVPIYGSWGGNCNWYTWPLASPMLVQRCSNRPGDFIYKVQGTGSCYWTFCGMDVAPTHD